MGISEKSEAADGVGSEHQEIQTAGDVGVPIAAKLEDAHAVPDPWAWGHVHLYLVCAIVYLCSTMNGNVPYLERDKKARAHF